MDRDSECDEQITEARISGVSTRALAKQHRCSSSEIEAAIDRKLDYQVDNALRLRLVRLSVERIEGLMKPFYERAIRDKDVSVGVLCCKLAERLSLLLGLDVPVQSRVDVYQIQASEQPRSFEKIREAIYRVARGPDWQPPAANGADGAVSVLSPPDDDKPSH